MGAMQVQGVEIHIIGKGEEDYISLTDMAGFDGERDTSHIDAWLRSKNTIDFLGVWERINNSNFNSVEFDRIRMEAGTNRFRLSAKQWAQKTNGVGLIARTGRYGGTFAHKDIAFEFGSWLSPEFKLYLIKEFQVLKERESKSGRLDWDIRRTLVKAQYRVHTDAVKDYLIPAKVSKKQEGYIYASEADLLNVALFGQTAKVWKSKNTNIAGTQRDNATIEQLVVLASLESQNALLIELGKSQRERLVLLNQLARKQMESLLTNPSIGKLSDKTLLSS
ncbi:MAG: KilA-N domain-containing protein [Nitrosomonas sp.]|nr:KilA-N domain-containing protein [Nitrosomonas sp.]